MNYVTGVPPYTPLFINSFSFRFTSTQIVPGYGGGIGALASAAWPANNRALFVPFALPFVYPVKRVFWCNGSNVTGNKDFGIYDGITGNKIYSTGSTAGSGTNANQYVSTDLLLPPGEYYMALAMSSTTGTAFRTTGISVNGLRLWGFLQQSTALPLPSSITGEAVVSAYWPLFGITRTSSGF